VKHQVNAPVGDPPLAHADTVAVTDPTHPLYGRRFAVHSVTHPSHGLGHVFVIYRDHVRLRLPLAATDLVPCRRPAHSPKFTPASIQQFLALAQECAHSCPNDPTPSGKVSPQR
jgi:hypothetical protein